MFKHLHLPEYRLLLVQHYGTYVDAENQTAIMDAMQQMDLTERWQLERILSDKTRVSEASLNNTDRAHTYFFYTKIAELLETTTEGLETRIERLKHAIVISSDSAAGEILSQRVEKVSPDQKVTIQQFNNLNNALDFLEVSERDLNKAGLSLPDLLLTGESAD